MWSEIRDGIGAYETRKSFGGKVVLEEFVLAGIIGTMTHSLWAGEITFLVIGTILIYVFPGVYGAVACGFLSLLCVPSWRCRFDFYGLRWRSYRNGRTLRKRVLV